MKSLYLFCVFLCLCITFSAVFGVNDVDTDTTLQFLMKEFHSLRNRVSVLESVIEKQSDIIQVQNDRIVKLEAVVKSGSINEDDMKNYSPHNFQSSDIDTQPSSLEKAQLNTPKASQEKMPNRAVRLLAVQHAAVQPVAFYAYMNSNLQNPGKHHTLIFDVTKTNEGNGYHAHLGVFIVPRSGTYFFSWTMGINQSQHSAELVVNNQAHGSIYRNTNGNLERDAVTGNLILNLNEHDEVYIRTGNEYNIGIIVSDLYGRSSFSGFLIE